MSSIVIATVPIHGHVAPLLVVAEHFTRRGDRVRFITGARFAEAVRRTGAEHVPLPADADFDDRQDWGAIFPERARLKGARAIAFDLENVFVRPGRAQHDAVMAAHADDGADVVLTEPAFAGGAATLGVFFEKAGEEGRTGTAGWYNSVAFEKAAREAGLYAKSINGDAFSDAIKQQVIETIKADLGQVDCVIYSLASPRRS